MTFKTLRYVLAVAEQGSVSAAARQLYLSQPSLSQSIQALEREVGVPLFDRSGSPLRLTPAGEHFVAEARKILALESGLMAEMGAMRAQGHPLRVSASAHRLRGLVADVHRRCLNLHPDLAVNLLEAEDDELERVARTGQADLVLVEGAVPDKLVGYRVLTEAVVLAVSRQHPAVRGWEAGAPLPLERFERDRFALPLPSMHLRRCVDRVFESELFVPRVLLETRSLTLLLEYARQGLAVAPVYETAARALREELALVALAPGGLRTSLYLCHRPELALRPVVREFIRLAQQRSGEALE